MPIPSHIPSPTDDEAVAATPAAGAESQSGQKQPVLNVILADLMQAASERKRLFKEHLKKQRALNAEKSMDDNFHPEIIRGGLAGAIFPFRAHEAPVVEEMVAPRRAF